MLRLRKQVWAKAMMNKVKKAVILSLTFSFALVSAQERVYDRVLGELTKYDNRLPGSVALENSMQVVEKELTRAGLTPRRQTYNTLVPFAKTCRLAVEGQEIPVHPLGPNGAATVTTAGKVLSGPIVYADESGLKSLEGIGIDGAIIVAELTVSDFSRFFAKGVNAVVFVGNEEATQWQVADHFTNLPISVPRFYVERKTAKEFGLLKADGTSNAEIEAAVVWKERQTANLWTEINGVEGKEFNMEAEEAIVLCAELSTFGAVPEKCPQQRAAANVALLTETAVELAKTNPLRSIYIVYFGSHYSAQEGARYFYWAYRKADKGSDKDPLPERAGYYTDEIAEVKAKLEVLDMEDFMESDNPQLFEVKQLLKKKLKGWVNSLNFEIGEIILTKDSSTTEEIRVLERKQLKMSRMKTVWNNMQKMLIEKHVAGVKPVIREKDVLNPIEFSRKLVSLSKSKNDLFRKIWPAVGEETQSLALKLQEAFEEQQNIELNEAEWDAFLEGLNAFVDNTSLYSEMQSSISELSLDYNPDEIDVEDEKLKKRTVNRLILQKAVGESLYKVIDYRYYFLELQAAVKSDLEARLSESERMLQHNETHQELSDSFIYRTKNDKDEEVEKVKPIIGHFHFDFANASEPWMLTIDGDSIHVNAGGERLVGPFIKNMGLIGELYEKTFSKGSLDKAHMHMQALSGTFTPGFLSFPQRRSVSSIVAQGAGVYGYNMVTVGDSLGKDELPFMQEADLSSLALQMKTFFKAMADDESLSIRSSIKSIVYDSDLVYTRSSGQPKGAKFSYVAKGTSELEGPATGAVFTGTIGGGIFYIKDLPGRCSMPMSRINGQGYTFVPAVRNYDDNNEYLAQGFDKTGKINRFSMKQSNAVRLFYAYGGGFFRPINPLSYDVAVTDKLLNASNDAEFKQMNVISDKNATVAYFDRPKNFKYTANGILLIGAIDGKADPVGYSYKNNEMVSLETLEQSAKDFVSLNRERLKKLRSRNIVNDSIELLQSDSQEQLTNSMAADEKNEHMKSSAAQTLSCILGFRAYEPLRTIANDMVGAVVILLILSIPFAFAMERLVFGCTTIYRQLLGFVGVFLATYILLRYTHPAFSLASAPTVIFLAFVIILMSAMVIFIVMSKFKHEIKALQGLVSKAHSSEGENSTAMASVLIGISGMRNRPLKTFLTATTIILLTFTILVFSSFTSKLGVVETYLGKGEGIERLEIHRPSFLNIPSEIVNAVESEYADKFDIYKRNALFSNPLRKKLKDHNPQVILYSEKEQTSTIINAVLGLEPDEVDENPALAKLFADLNAYSTDSDLPPIYLSKFIAVKTLGLEVGDKVKIFGKEFVYAGAFDSGAVQSFMNIDGTRVTPPDYEATMRESDVESGVENKVFTDLIESIDINSFVWTQVDMVALTSFDALTDMRSEVNFLGLYPKGVQDTKKNAKKIAQTFKGPIFAQTPEGSYQLFFTKALEGSGMSEIIVPLLLGGLIIFSSLLGSIVDREREIFTYSALGLAPPDVAALFFAESSVYAVIGGMGGYLFSQLVAKFLGILAETGLFQPPEMNFSSLSSIYTILLVMGTVILSTIYPALKAGRSANPGVARKWKMPEPKGNRLEFVFPFTVSSSDLAGVLSFIREHFDNHGDASLGSFAAKEVNLFKVRIHEGEEASLGIQATMSLAPFDLGVFQKFRLYSKDSDIEGIKEVVIDLERLSGPPRSWIRSNRQFIDELRNQFLLWRSLPVETVEHYRKQTEKTLQNGQG